MTLSVLFWNIWLDNQMQGADRAGKFLAELQRITQEYQPDFIGLNEVLQATGSSTPFVSDFLKNECGYNYTHFAASSPYTDDWLIGAGLYSRTKFDEITDVAISRDTPADRRGYPGYQLKAIAAKVRVKGNHRVNIIVAHPMHLRPHTIHDHYEGTANLNNLVRTKKFLQNTVLGGDFNEPGFMPKAFKHQVADVMECKTGSIMRPTWRHNASRLTPIRANLDQLYWSQQCDFELQSFTVLDSGISDHRPILATFEFK